MHRRQKRQETFWNAGVPDRPVCRRRVRIEGVGGDGVRRLPDDECDPEVIEIWERVGSERDLQLVDAVHSYDLDWPWYVGASVMEFIRVEPLESTLRQAMNAALLAVPGVEAVARKDREEWYVIGSPTGRELVLAAAGVVDAFLEQTRAVYNAL